MTSLWELSVLYSYPGEKSFWPVVGFFEVTIWLLAISQIMQHDNIASLLPIQWICHGNFVGILIEDKLAMGTLVIRIIIANNETDIQKKPMMRAWSYQH